MNSMVSLDDVARKIKNRDNFVVLGHVEPDGDCVGSMVAMKLVLDSLGKNSILILHDFPFIRYEFLFSLIRGAGKVKQPATPEKLFNSLAGFHLFSEYKGHIPEQFSQNEFSVLALDSGSRERLGKEAENIIDNNFLFNLDHHPDNPEYGDLNYVDPGAAAVGEIIYDLAQKLGVGIKKAAGTALATALISDTGSLRYKNTSARILKILANLMELSDVDLYEVNNHLFGNQDFSALKLQGLALANLQKSSGGQIAWLYVDRDMFRETGAEESDASGLVNFARDIRGVKVGIAFIEKKETEEIKVSFRSNTSEVPVNEIASVFSGGGHARAAGCEIKQDLNQALESVLHEVKKFVQ
ncbi:MAG: DHH family phosphoesterase [Halanaerobiaceae bacterium]